MKTAIINLIRSKGKTTSMLFHAITPFPYPMFCPNNFCPPRGASVLALRG